MIMLSGLRYPEDIDIEFTGLRPGEKLYEELFYETETGAKKIHEKIFCGNSEQAPPVLEMISRINQLAEAATGETQTTLLALRELVQEYTGTEWSPSRMRKAA